MMIKTFVVSTLFALCVTGCHRKHTDNTAGADPQAATTAAPAPQVIVVPSPQVIPVPSSPSPTAPATIIVQPSAPGAVTQTIVPAAVAPAAPAPAPTTTVVVVPSQPPQPSVYIPPTSSGPSINMQADDAGVGAGHFAQVGDDLSGSGIENP